MGGWRYSLHVRSAAVCPFFVSPAAFSCPNCSFLPVPKAGDACITEKTSSHVTNYIKQKWRGRPVYYTSCESSVSCCETFTSTARPCSTADYFLDFLWGHWELKWPVPLHR